ncbi:MAG: ROK family protein [Acidobacteria bacterium]|nr:MAG: ROK family protein [Acidobacteriota bacterium]
MASCSLETKGRQLMTRVYAAVDLGGTNTACALGHVDGTILCERTDPTYSHEGPDAVLERIASVLKDMASAAGEEPVALGIGAPGLVDRAAGTTLFLPNLPGQWRNVPVAATLGSRLGCPVYLLNDVRTATLGELTYGAGARTGSLVFLSVGTGIGGGVVIDGKLRLGPFGAAGELGHQTILPDGLLCGCGSRGCLETLASGPAISAEGVRLLRCGLAPRLHQMVGGRSDYVTPKEMKAAAEAGDDAVRAALVRAATYLGIAVANAILMLHPELVVLGGGVSALGPILIDTVKSTVRERVTMFPLDGIRIEQSPLGDKAGIYGAIALATRCGQV